MPRRVEGIGLGLREGLEAELLSLPSSSPNARVDWLEIAADNFLSRGAGPRRVLSALAERYPIIPHALSLSVGGFDPLDGAFLDAMASLVRSIDAPWWSDHLGCVRARGAYVQGLLPLPMSTEAVEHLAPRAKVAEARVGAPLILENAVSYAVWPGTTMNEGQYLRAVTEATGCGLLLDLNNLVVNVKNLGGDAIALLSEIPLDRVTQIHLAGHAVEGGVAIDTHDRAVGEETWALYRCTIARAKRIIPTLIEWDANLPPIARLLEEVSRARDEAESAIARGVKECA